MFVSRGKRESERMWAEYMHAQSEERVEDESYPSFEMSHLFGNKTLEAVKPVRWPSAYTPRRRGGVANQVCLFAGVARDGVSPWDFERD